MLMYRWSVTGNRCNIHL